jgi:hypothetical protein
VRMRERIALERTPRRYDLTRSRLRHTLDRHRTSSRA